jgi:hypothetical protein
MNVELLGRDHPKAASSMTHLANCLVATGEFEEALGYATEARNIFAGAYSESHWRTASAMGAGSVYVNQAARRLASLYSEWGKPERAAEYLAMADE